MGLRIRHVVVGRVRGRDLGLSFDAGDVNVFTGCNGSFKTTVLEVLTASLLTVYPRSLYPPDPLYILSSTLRMDPFWLYWLIKDGFSATLSFNNGDSVSFRSVDDTNELMNLLHELNVTMPSQYQYPPIGVEGKLEGGNKRAVLWIALYKYMASPSGINYLWNIGKAGDLDLGVNFMSVSIPNPLSNDFFYAVSKAAQVSRALELIKELVGFEFVGFKLDQFDRYLPHIKFNDRDVPIHMVGSGYLVSVVVALVSTGEIALIDNIETHLHPGLMESISNLILNSETQWFITTQSREFIEILLARSLDLKEKNVVIIEMSRRARPRVFNAKEAWRHLTELNEDLRGICL